MNLPETLSIVGEVCQEAKNVERIHGKSDKRAEE